jgi:hypothetical protein
MKFALMRSLFRDASSQKVSKNLKIVCDEVTLTKTSLVTAGTFSPLGVKRTYLFLSYNSYMCSYNFEVTFMICIGYMCL